jgi:hypothetical protein
MQMVSMTNLKVGLSPMEMNRTRAYTVEEQAIDLIILVPDPSLGYFNILCLGPSGTRTAVYVRVCMCFCWYSLTYLHRPHSGALKC